MAGVCFWNYSIVNHALWQALTTRFLDIPPWFNISHYAITEPRNQALSRQKTLYEKDLRVRCSRIFTSLHVNNGYVIEFPPKFWHAKFFIVGFSNVAGENIASHYKTRDYKTLQKLARSCKFVGGEQFGAKSGWNRVVWTSH